MSKIILDILKVSSDDVLAKSIVGSYSDMQTNYLLNKPKYSGLDAGHFVEAVRRFLELKLFGAYTPLADNLRKFNDSELQRYANSQGSDNYRLIIPRILYSMYTLRNKRGIGHLSEASPSSIDSSYLLSSCKWILAEIIRAEAKLAENECMMLIEKIVSREIPLVWKTPKFSIITNTALNAKDKILILLLDEDGISFEQIKKSILYGNTSRLHDYIKILSHHGYVHEHDGCVYLSPQGQVEAEKKLIAYGEV